MKIIPLTKGKEAKVDDGDYEWLTQWSWCYNGRYAVRGLNQKSASIIMHREIINAPNNYEVDHVNGDKLDNRRKNLRVCTRAENQRNKKLQRNNTSGYKGVKLDKRYGTWAARIKYLGRQIHLGTFKTPKEAAVIYNEAAKKYFGEFAWINPIENED